MSHAGERSPEAGLGLLDATMVGIGAMIGAGIFVLAGPAAETVIAEAAADFMPPVPVFGTGTALIVFGAVFSTISALNAVVVGSSRVAFAIGREGQLPARLGQIHPRFGAPFLAVLASALGWLAVGALVYLTWERYKSQAPATYPTTGD